MFAETLHPRSSRPLEHIGAHLLYSGFPEKARFSAFIRDLHPPEGFISVAVDLFSEPVETPDICRAEAHAKFRETEKGGNYFGAYGRHLVAQTAIRGGRCGRLARRVDA